MSGHVSTETLSAYLDGELEAAEAAPLGAHLDGCAECAARLDRLQSTAATLRQLERPLPPAAVTERLRLQLAAERQRKARPLWWDALLPWRSMQPGMAAAALVFVTALLVMVQMERMATRNAESTQAKSEMRSLEEREQEAAAAPTVVLPPAPRAAPAGGAEPARADGDTTAAVAIPERADAPGTEGQAVEIASAETAAMAANDAVATGGAARDEEDRRGRLSAQAAPPPAYEESAVADAAPVSRSATSAAPAAAARVLAESPPERTAAGRTFVAAGGRWLEIGLALDAEPVEKVRREEPLSEDLLRRWPDLRILLADRVPVRLRHEGRILELQP